jgi:hypothetical protein
MACAFGAWPLLARAEATVGLDRVVEGQMDIDKASRASQERVNELDDDANALLSEYRRAVADAESFTAYADQLALQVQSQNDEMAAMNRQLGEVDKTSREFVALDVPFLLDERRNRVQRLQEMMGRADVTISEKYRRIIEAYQVEMDYGRTVEAFEAKLGDESDARTVQFLRIGRVGLLYQTLDGEETGFWDVTSKRWVVDDSYAGSFKEGLAVARKTRAPELLVIPVPASKGVQS